MQRDKNRGRKENVHTNIRARRKIINENNGEPALEA